MPSGSLIKRQGNKTVCKARGFTLNYNAKHLINFHVIRNMILNPNIDEAVADSDCANRKKDQTQEK
jgi:hypothetical protein